MKRYKWGVLATGRIAASMAQAMRHDPRAELSAVASRSQDKADAFAHKWGLDKAYGSYEALLADPDIEIVYIATPNAVHKDNILAAIKAGKHILCEKPLTTRLADTLECERAAREANVFLMEGMWSVFFPAMQRVKTLLDAGAIGRPSFLTAQFIAYRDPAEYPNLFDPKLGGGALNDLGVYPLAIAQFLLGAIRDVLIEQSIGTTGVDEMTVMSAVHANGAVSQLSCGFQLDLPVSVKVMGTKGEIEIPDHFHHADLVTLRGGGKSRSYREPYTGNGYIHEIQHVHECLDQGILQSPICPKWAQGVGLLFS